MSEKREINVTLNRRSKVFGFLPAASISRIQRPLTRRDLTHCWTCKADRSCRWSRGTIALSVHGESGRSALWRAPWRSRRRCIRRRWWWRYRRNSRRCQRTASLWRRTWSLWPVCCTRDTSISIIQRNPNRASTSRHTCVKTTKSWEYSKEYSRINANARALCEMLPKFNDILMSRYHNIYLREYSQYSIHRDSL